MARHLASRRTGPARTGGAGHRLLVGGPWVAACAVAASPLLFPADPWVRPVAITAFLVLVLVRVAVPAATLPRERRTPMLIMGLGLGLFVCGSLVLALHPAAQFPSPIEGVFAAAYACFTWFLVVDANGGRVRDRRTLLEAGVVAGGIISAAVFVLVLSAGARLGLTGVPLLVAIAYPIADLVLLTTVLTQLLTGRRAGDRRSGLLLGGLLLLAAVDISLPLGLGTGGYAFSTLQDLLWGISLTVLAEAATRRPASLRPTRTGIGSGVPVGAGLCALLVLVTGPRSGSPLVTEIPAALTIVMLLGLLLGSVRDARRGVEAQRLSLTDDLTGLGNRRAVMEALTTAPGESLTLLLMDLNGFKVINDTLGHQHGDLLLERFADRLREVLSDAVLIARLGGDEFAVVYRGVDVPRMTVRVEALMIAMCLPLKAADLGLTVSMSMGISSDDRGDTDGVELLRRADVAMYRAKAEGGGYQWYDAAVDKFSTENLHLVEDLRSGIAAGQLRSFYQPQVSALDGSLVAVEALVRWEHPTRGVLRPQDFLPVARKAGLMIPFSLEMIGIAIAQAAAWEKAGTPLRLSLNVDPPELLSGQWVPALLGAIGRHRLDPHLVTVELTEDLLINDYATATASIRKLAEHGIGVSIDDFGTGYSGLSWLQTLPVAELKLDRGFVSRLLTDERTRHIVESTVDLADRLGIRVVAEGVEDEATASVLAGMGAHLLQGYGICHPLRAESLEQWRIARDQAGVEPVVPLPSVPPAVQRG